MKFFSPGSLQLRLALSMTALLLISTLLVTGLFAYLGHEIADELSRRNLFPVAEIIAAAVKDDGLEFVTSDRDLIDPGVIFAVRRTDGSLLGSSGEEVKTVLEDRPVPHRDRELFQIEGFGGPNLNYSGIEVRRPSVIGDIFVLVAEPTRTDAQLLDVLLEEIGEQAAWILPLFVAATLLVGVFAIRRGLQPLMVAARRAASINPESISVRLNVKNMPNEAQPLILAINQALGRVEEGFAIQRRFTAHAAHELRTPLTIITAALDNMSDTKGLDKLREDVHRMNRVVEQLLHASRLGSIKLDTSQSVDLRKSARKVVENLAPMAFLHGRSLALISASDAVSVYGDSHSIEGALRNLVENALTHTPVGTEAIVAVLECGAISVSDNGNGIPLEQLQKIFDPFWRGSGSRATGAGLGLAIVRQIMDQHEGEVSLDKTEQGGAKFTLQFKLVSASDAIRSGHAS